MRLIIQSWCPLTSGVTIDFPAAAMLVRARLAGMIGLSIEVIHA